MEFFRFCPSCGRRFHIRLVSKQALHIERRERRRTETYTAGGSPAWGPGGSGVPIMTIVREGVPIIVDVEEFQYNYRCKHCGHEWSEKLVKEHKER
jgi:hypothetical protein